MLSSLTSLNARRAKLARRRKHSAFTLVEIMIVVLIIGILLAIAVPNFVRARETSRGKSCVANLKQISSAEDQWALDNKKGAADPAPVLATDLVGTDKYIKSTPTCPSNGTYTVAAVGTNPTCSISTNTGATYAPHILP